MLLALGKHLGLFALFQHDGSGLPCRYSPIVWWLAAISILVSALRTIFWEAIPPGWFPLYIAVVIVVIRLAISELDTRYVIFFLFAAMIADAFCLLQVLVIGSADERLGVMYGLAATACATWRMRKRKHDGNRK